MAIGSRRRFLGSCVSGLGAVGYSALALAEVRAETTEHAGSGAATDKFLDAVRLGDKETVSKLIAAHADLVNARDGQGRTAFALAYLHRHPAIGEFLRDKGYQPDTHESALSLDWDRLGELAKAAPGMVNTNHPIGGNAMYAAAVGGAGDEIWRVYQYGAEPDPRPGSGEGAALIAALEYPTLLVAESGAAMLLGNGASPNLVQADKRSPLHVAAGRGSAVIVEMLVRKGGVVDARDEQGFTARELAERNGHSAVVTLLENHGAIARDHSTSRLAYDVHGQAFKPGELDAFSVLARNQLVGAAHFNFDEVRTTVDRYPELAKAIATTTEASVEACAHTGRKDIVEYLLERGTPYSLPTAVMRNDVKRVKELLAEDPRRIHERGPHDFGLLWYPVIGGGLVELAELLIRNGAQVEQQHHLGTTALHWAVRNGQRDMVALLIDNGADVNRVGRKFDQNGETPLQTAANHDRGDIAELLRAHGAKS